MTAINLTQEDRGIARYANDNAIADFCDTLQEITSPNFGDQITYNDDCEKAIDHSLTMGSLKRTRSTLNDIAGLPANDN